MAQGCRVSPIYSFSMQKSHFFTETKLFGILLKYNLIEIWPAGITKKMTDINQKLIVPTRNDGSITVDVNVFIINKKFNYLFSRLLKND